MSYLPTPEETRVISYVVQGQGGLKQALEHFGTAETDWIKGWRRGAVYGDDDDKPIPPEVSDPIAFVDGRTRGLLFRTVRT